MLPAAAQPTALPMLREDLRVEPAAPLASGAPAWVIYDPARHRYFQIGRRVVEMLSFWALGTAEALRERLARERGWRPGTDEVKELIAFLLRNELTMGPSGGRSAQFAAANAKARTGLLRGVVKNYLFFRVPLVRPQPFLDATLPFVRFLFTRAFVLLTVLTGCVALALTLRQLDAFLAYAGRFVSLDGALFYAAAIVFVKVLHELGHAYQATLRGTRVMTMGVAFMVMFPLLYTDVSDAWRLRDRRDKLMIDAGGVIVELSLAAFATMLWVFLPDGAVRSATFVVATTSWVLSLLVNLNPFMRFDGYYLLSDGTGVQNLQPRAFALMRWRLREALFGLGAAPPERMAPGMRRFMVLYGAGTTIYRLLLFIDIALTVYHVFFKALGVVLFVVEIAAFIALPIFREVGVWFSLRGRIVRKPRAWITGAILLGLLALLLVPLPTRVHVPAVMSFEGEADVYPLTEGRLADMALTLGARVEAGEVLARIASPELASQVVRTERRIALLDLRLDRGAGDASERAQSVVLRRELEAERETLAGLRRSERRLAVVSPIDGIVVQTDRRLDTGRWIGRDTLVARIADPSLAGLRGYLSEDDLARLDIGAEGTFVPDDPSRPSQPVRLSRVADVAASRLDPGYVASSNGGPVPVQPAREGAREAPRPFGSWFAIRAEFIDEIEAESGLPAARRGVAVFRGRPESWAERAFAQVARVLLRESAF